MLGRSVTFGPKYIEKHLIKGTLKNLTTPSAHEFGAPHCAVDILKLRPSYVVLLVQCWFS